MNIKVLSLVFCVVIMGSCTPKITTSVTKAYSPLDYKEDVRVFGLEEDSPINAEVLGTVKIGDSGFTTDCGWDLVIEKAKLEARKLGGNALKITEHRPPSAMGSTCHRITATLLKVSDIANIAPAKQLIDSALLNADYALIHIYRNSSFGALVNYDLHLGDSVLTRVTINSKKTVKVRKTGYNTIWAKTESKTELPINIQLGHEYYVRCGIAMGILVGRPYLELVSNREGKTEYASIKRKKNDPTDQLVMNDGRTIRCTILSEDETSVQFSVLRNGQETTTFKSKSEIKSIERGAID